MSFAKVYSAQASLMGGTIISVEADLSKGLHSFSVVGLPDKAIEEAKDRIGAAIKNSGFPSPKSKNQKITLSLAPADIKKEGPAFDVPMALAYLLSADEIHFDPEKRLFLGELALDGKVRPVTGILPLAREARDKGFTEIYVPAGNAREATLVESILVYSVERFKDVVDHINDKTVSTEDPFSEPRKKLNVFVPPPADKQPDALIDPDFADIYGQESAKRALMIAAAGGHNCALYGPPGTGKTLLAKAFPCVLPDLTFAETLDVMSIYSVAGLLTDSLIIRPPFRSPHHTSSYVAIVGGGTYPKPGELTLAHKGVLFLDEFPEFDRRVIDALRQPLEERQISISRSKGTTLFPADVILIAALNPCPCGNFGTRNKECRCMPGTIARYQKKLSGPIIDRIDLWSHVADIDRKALSRGEKSGESSSKIRERVNKARSIQKRRFESINTETTVNARMSAKEVGQLSMLEPDAERLLISSSEKLGLSGRAHHRIMKIARTIADLEEKEKIDSRSILEALQYRPPVYTTS